MKKSERLQKIADILEEKNVVMVNELQQLLQVTEMTVRRDLTLLEAEGKAERIHGGAKKADHATLEQLPHKERIHEHYEAKNIIAKKAAAFIQDRDVIFISAGTTNELLKQYIDASSLIIVTNCLYIFEQYAKNDQYETILIGGKYNKKTESLLGNITLQEVSMMNFTKAFVGTNGIYNKKLCASNDEEATLHKKILEQARETYILCGSEKFGRDAFYSFFPCEDITAIITDQYPEQYGEELEKVTNIL